MDQFVLALAALLAANNESAAAAEPRVEVWAGHQVSNGKRKIPLYGEKETHTENYFIAEVHRMPSRIDIRQKTCRIDIRPIKGVTPTMKPETIARLPKAHIMLEEKADGSLVAAPWSTGWETEDIDADGFPGATGDTAIFGSALTSNLTLSLAANRTLGYLVFNDNNNVTLQNNTLNFDVTTMGARGKPGEFQAEAQPWRRESAVEWFNCSQQSRTVHPVALVCNFDAEPFA